MGSFGKKLRATMGKNLCGLVHASAPECVEVHTTADDTAKSFVSEGSWDLDWSSSEGNDDIFHEDVLGSGGGGSARGGGSVGDRLGRVFGGGAMSEVVQYQCAASVCFGAMHE